MYIFEIQEREHLLLVIFSGRNQGNSFDYGATIDKTLTSYPGKYHSIVFLSPSYLQDSIIKMIEDGERLISNFLRHGEAVSINFYSFNGYGEITNYKNLGDNRELYFSNETLQEIIVRDGLDNLVRERQHSVILTSPPGTTFRKPSGDEYSEFIKASELAIGCAENQFVAFCMLTKRPKSRDIKRIFVDSNSIAAYVVALMSYMREFSESNLCQLSYSSFNSYEGLEENEPDFKNDIWVIISASSSNKLGKTVYEKWQGVSHDQIITLLSYKNSELNDEGVEKGIGDKIVANISAYSSVKETKIGRLIPIQIIGENFTAQIDQPDLIILKKNHLPEKTKKILIDTSKTTVFSLNKSDGRKTRNIHFDSMKYIEEYSDVFFNWLHSAVIWNVPYGVKFIVLDNSDPAAVFMCNKLKTLLPDDIIVIDAHSIENHRYNDCSVLVLSSVVSTGRLFLRINRDLRMANHSGPRIFICILSLFKASKLYNIFEKSLTQSEGDYKYKLLSFRCMVPGEHEITDAWKNELRVVEGLRSPVFATRAKNLRDTSKGIPQGIGVSFGDTPLQFNKGFAFWGVRYEPKDIIHASVYLSISCILQNLRDRPSCEPDSLYHHVYKHAVIDPENFSRLNEGVIQASLWRAAEQAETNYRYMQEVSNSFAAILVNLAKEIEKNGENGLADLLLGVAIGKIQLHDDALEIIVNDIKRMVSNIDPIRELIEYIECVIINGTDPTKVGPVF